MNDYDGKVVIGTDLDTKSVDAQITKLEKDLEIMVKTLETDMQIPVGLRMSEDEKLKLESDIEKTKNRIISLKESMQDVGSEADKNTDKISKGFKKGTTTLKRFALSLFGIHSMYRLASRASSAWLSQDTELAQRLQNVWIGLGALVSPILEKMSTLILKALGYLNEFVKALSGGRIDFIAKANAKALEKQAKTQKELNRQTYDFDEIRKQQEMSTSTSGGITGGGIDIPELDSRVVKKLQDLAKWLRENQELVKGLGIVLGITFGAFQIAKLVSNIGTLIGSAGAGTGLAGLNSLLVGLTKIGVIAIGVSLLYTGITGRSLISDLKEVKQSMDDLKGIQEEQQNARKVALEDNLKLVEEINNALQNGNIKEEEANKLEEMKKEKVENIKKILQDWKILYGLNADEINRVNDALKDDKTTVADIKEDINAWSVGIKTAKEGYKLMFGTIGEYWNKLKNKFIEAYTGGSKGSKAYALGGIVTQPTRALIGEAGYPEAVVPMTGDYLSTLASEIGKYSGGSSGNVNVYLDGRLIQREMARTTSNKNFTTNGG